MRRPGDPNALDPGDALRITLIGFFLATFAFTWIAWLASAALAAPGHTGLFGAWLYWKTEGSLLLVMVMHASVNNTTDIVPAAGPARLTRSRSAARWWPG